MGLGEMIGFELKQFSLILMGILVLIILYSVIGNLLQHKHFHAIHQTGIGILIGLLFGLGLYFFNAVGRVTFSEEVFFYGLLPPMIFAGGYNLKKKDFGKNFKYILIFGLLGTLVTFGLILGLTWAINSLHLIRPLRSENHIEYLEPGLMVKYSATISATDSVAALTLIKPSEHPKIFSVIFGEGMVNDAVAIILFKVVGGIFDKAEDEEGESTPEKIQKIFGSFVTTVFFSLLIGLLVGLLCSYLFKRCRFLAESEVVQTALTYLFGIWSYVIAQYFDLSGVITVLISGIVLAHYNFYNLTVGGMHATSITFQSISFIAQAIVFVYLGVSTIYYLTTEVISLSFLGLELAICLASRFLTIAILSLIFRCIYKGKWTLGANELSVIAFAGSIRGSVAFALILTIQANQNNADQVSVIKSTTLIMVCFTTILFGALMPRLINCMLGPSKQSSDSNPIPEIEEEEENQIEVELLHSQRKKDGFFKHSDENYWRPFLIWDYKARKEQIALYKKLMKFNSRGQYEGGNFNALVTMEARQSVLNNFVMEVDRRDMEKDEQ